MIQYLKIEWDVIASNDATVNKPTPPEFSNNSRKLDSSFGNISTKVRLPSITLSYFLLIFKYVSCVLNTVYLSSYSSVDS